MPSRSPNTTLTGKKSTKVSITASHIPLDSQKMLKLKQYRGSDRLLIQVYFMGTQFAKVATVHPIQKHIRRLQSAKFSRRNSSSTKKSRLYMSRMDNFVDEVMEK